MPRTTWFSLLAPPAAWFVALNAAYFMTSWACGSSVGRLSLHAILAAMLLIGLAAAIAGARAWRRTGRDWPGESAEPMVRTRFLSAIGTFGGLLFSVAILWFWLAATVLDPCEPEPRLPFAPSALVARPPPGSAAPGELRWRAPVWTFGPRTASRASGYPLPEG